MVKENIYSKDTYLLMIANNPNMVTPDRNLKNSEEKPTEDASKDGIESVFPRLYDLSIRRRFSQKIKEEEVISKKAWKEARRESSISRCNKNSELLSLQRTSQRIEDTLRTYSNKEGNISKQNFLFTLQTLNVIRDLKCKTYADFQPLPKKENARELLELKFINLTWELLEVTEETLTDSKLIHKILLILLQKPSKEELLRKMFTDFPRVKSLVKTFQGLVQGQLVYSKKSIGNAQEFPHKPKINRMKTTKSVAQIKRNWEEKAENMRKKDLEEEQKTCTFKPELVTKRRTSSFNIQKHRHPHLSTDEKELELCTFKPTIFTKNNRKRNTQSVGKLNKSKEETKNYNKIWKIKNQRSYKTTKKGNRENKCNTEEDKKEIRVKTEATEIEDRKFFDNKLHKERGNILAYVYINISKGRKGRITIHDDDDPRELAGSFCRTYGLRKDTEAYLENLLKQHLISALADIL